jgi:pantetheine-phosphate adenylyltransferase
VFSSVIIAVSENAQKEPLFDLGERTALIEEACRDLPNVSVHSFHGLLIDFVRHHEAGVIIRGLRAVTDFEYEFAMALMNKSLAEEIETVFLATSEGHSFVSSSMVKEVFRLGGDISSKVPACVMPALAGKIPVPGG